jgi:hypothetical protein
VETYINSLNLWQKKALRQLMARPLTGQRPDPANKRTTAVTRDGLGIEALGSK